MRQRRGKQTRTRCRCGPLEAAEPNDAAKRRVQVDGLAGLASGLPHPINGPVAQTGTPETGRRGHKCRGIRDPHRKSTRLVTERTPGMVNPAGASRHHMRKTSPLETRLRAIEQEWAQVQDLHARMMAVSLWKRVQMAEDMGVLAVHLTGEVIGLLRDLTQRVDKP